MPRSSVTRLSSAFRRRISAESLKAAGVPSFADRAAFFASCTQPYSVCLGTPIRVATSTTVNPRSRTCLTASALNSAVYCLLIINTSFIAMNYGN